MRNTASAVRMAIHAPGCRDLCRKKSNELTPATSETAIHAPGLRRSHGETTNATIAVKPASMCIALVHFFSHNGQKRKKDATSNNCPLNIVPAARRHPDVNQRVFKAPGAANKSKGTIHTSHCGQPCASRI